MTVNDFVDSSVEVHDNTPDINYEDVNNDDQKYSDDEYPLIEHQYLMKTLRINF